MILRAAVAAAAILAAGMARAEVDPDYRPLLEPVGRIMRSCLDGSQDHEGDLACRTRTEEACETMGPVGGLEAGIALCAGLLMELWDGELNRVWPDVLARQDAPEADYLRAEQRAWIAYRDAACDFEVAQVWGGSKLSYVGGQCLVDRTAERVAQLRDYIRYP